MKLLGATIHLLVVALLIVRPAVAGEVYTWTDADGNINITDRPPENSAAVESVIRYSDPTEADPPPAPAQQQDSVEMQHVKQLKKRLKRLKERKTQLEKIIAENKASIAAAQKDATYYQKRSGSYARRNLKSIERQLMVLNNNLTTYQSDQRYVEEDIAETEKRIATMGLNRMRAGGESGRPTPRD